MCCLYTVISVEQLLVQRLGDSFTVYLRKPPPKCPKTHLYGNVGLHTFSGVAYYPELRLREGRVREEEGKFHRLGGICLRILQGEWTPLL